MATQASAGFNGTLEVNSNGDGVTYNVVAELQEAKISADVESYDATSHGSAGAKEFVPGNLSWQATAAALRVFSDAAQGAIEAALAGKTKLKLRIRPQGTGSGKPQRVGFAYLTKWEETAPNSGLVAENLTFQGTGALDFTPQ